MIVKVTRTVSPFGELLIVRKSHWEAIPSGIFSEIGKISKDGRWLLGGLGFFTSNPSGLIKHIAVVYCSMFR